MERAEDNMDDLHQGEKKYIFLILFRKKNLPKAWF